MQHRRVYLFMFGTGLLLLTLIMIQVVWLLRLRSLERKDTDIRIMRALHTTGRQLEQSVSCFEAYSKRFIPPGDKLYLLHARQHAGTRHSTQDTLSIVYNPGDFFPDTAIIKKKAAGFPYPSLAELKLNFRVPESEIDEEQLQQAAALNDAAPHSFRDLIHNRLSLASIVNTGKADSLLRANLELERIAVNELAYGFSNPANHRLEYSSAGADSALLARSSYSVPLFTNTEFLQPRLLSVSLVGLQESHGFLSWLLLSIAIVLLVSLGFYLFVRRYIQQIRLSQLKTDFINNLSHEFNTPMANIELAVETLSEKEAGQDPSTTRILTILSLETHKLRENIERSLQVATLEQGRLPLERTPVDLVPLINAILAGYQSQCEQLEGSIKFSHPATAIIYGDEVHLLNSVCNLLDNAIKYRSGKPQIHISLQRSATEITLQVSDKGRGMSQDVQRHIFEKFYRAHQGDVHNTKGFGLGLNYVKGIIDAHGGHITVRSKPGAGSTFTIHLPLKAYGTAA